MTNEQNPQTHDELQESLGAVRRRLRTLTVAVLLLTLAVMVCAAAIFSNLLNYFGGDSMLNGIIFFLAALLGFVFGWYAGRKA